MQLLCPVVAHAAWHQASSEHFVVYANQSSKNIKRYTEKLERYHAAFGTLVKNDGLAPSPSNRVTVYVVGSDWQVKKLYGTKGSKYVIGFYQGRAGGSIAIVPKIKGGSGGEASQSEKILLHEYAHHFMYSNFNGVVPRWFGEGFAEFFATAKFERDGGVGLGLPASNRRYELETAHNIPLQEIFDTRLYLKNKKTKRYDNFYGRSWLLYHYLFFSVDRRGQLGDYLGRLQGGENEFAAAKASFGSLETLNSELRRYMRRRSFHYIKVAAEALKITPIRVRKLFAGEAAMMPVIIRSNRGVNREQALELLPEAREVASRFPSSPVVLAALAEAEVDAGNYADAIVAADSAIAIDSANIEAHIQKGYAMTSLAKTVEDSAEKKAAWKDVRLQFARANRLEIENPLPLVHFYRSYLHQGIKPTKNSVVGLESALDLAPFDNKVRALVARQQLKEERFVDARDTLVPLAYGPHQKADNAFLVLLKHAERQIEEQGASLEVPK